MKKIKVMTDSNSGITQSEGKKLDVEVVPMPFMINGEEYFEDINLSQEQFYNLINDANVCTSQPAIGFISEIWSRLLKEYDEIVYIPMSSGLSMSCKSAETLANTEPFKGKVFVVDNQRISITQKRSVAEALQLAKEGYSGAEIKDILMKNRANSSIYIMVDTLKYLKKGGRITPAVALMGTLLKIKPILQIHGEKLDSFKKTRTLENAKLIMLDQVEKDMENIYNKLNGKSDDYYIDIAHTNNLENALKFKQEIIERFGDRQTIVDPLSLSVSCHIGPGALAIAVTKKLIK